MKPGLSARVAAHPLRWCCLFYLGVTLAGGALLSLPQSASPELRHEEGDYLYKRILNCTFTSVSASTLTGLSIYDTRRDFSRFGQCVILGLMQVGGLGALTIGGLVVQRAAVGAAAQVSTRRLIGFIVLAALGLETVGAGLLYSLWPASVESTTERAFYAAFHSVSAFCNAGFTLSQDSLVKVRGAWQVYAVILPLIVAGGLGGFTLYELVCRPRSLSVQARVALALSGLLILVPTAVLYLLESRDWRRDAQRLPPEVAALMQPPMADMPPAERFSAALFQSASARSAGFHTAALTPDSLSPAAAGLLCVVMFIGGSPGSAAGGVTTVAVAMLALGLLRKLRPPPAGLKAEDPMLRRSVGIVLAMLVLAALTALALAMTERGARPVEALFEAVSASGNSGLSMGLTPRLSIAGRIVVILTMLSGRALTVGFAATLWFRQPDRHRT